MRTTFDFAPIRAAFGFSEESDRDVARTLAQRISRTPFDPPGAIERAKLSGREVHVLGASDEARAQAGRIPRGAPLWTADGATTAALEAGRVPTVVVTDLDGRVEDQVKASRQGAIVFIHAHGDNREAIERWLPELEARNVAGTCQVAPPPPLFNPGGFTDGDRAVFLALALGAARVTLHAFDFERPGRYSGVKDSTRKRLKLAWARRVIDGLVADGAPVHYA